MRKIMHIQKIAGWFGILCLPVLFMNIPLLGQGKSEVIEKVFQMDASRPAELEFLDVDGNLYLSPSADSSISVRIKKDVKIRDARRAERILRETKVELHHQGNFLKIRIRYPRFKGIFFWLSDTQRVKVVSEISVPVNSRVKAHLVDGSIYGEGLQADLDLNIVDGDIRLTEIKGTARIHDVDGKIHISGDLKDLHLRSVDGDIRVNLSQASVMEKDWDIRTVDGDVDVTVPADFSADVSLQTEDGRVETEVPLLTTKETFRKKLTGKLNNGGFLFSIRTTDGRISLRKQ
jgi:DUF4097 and DUF4098 domain-containing protein YvlB